MADERRKLELAQRRNQALQMRIAGVSPTLIAERLGYNSPQAAAGDITAALKRAAKAEGLAAEHLLHLEIDRLDRMMAALWPKVLKGEVNAADTCLKIIHKRASLLGLDQINRNGAPDNDMASLLGAMLAQLQQRYQVADPDLDAIAAADVHAEVVTGEVLWDDAGGEA
ncbi:hypothetical protein [Nonomuraea wenchangensis]|uniref:Uncharacterized protein n=1 Tax=Nonomuraea wenchangensis TaxID=568860 RepID=A0A1I0LVH4_9ACTN|nr:hypothetical protein [Nonomuraea wenchangensis]SEU46566.1 hypothetical protein SAMN05421811_12780 [Nonomuraea wenchangensis]